MLTSVTFSSTSVSMQGSTIASLPNLSFPSIPGEFPFTPSRTSTPGTPSLNIYPFHIPSSPSSSHDTPGPRGLGTESSAKVRLRETPSLRIQGLKQRLRATEAKLSAAAQKHQREHNRLAINTAREASTMQYTQDLAAWEQRAASYEQQLRAQEARLLEVTAENAAVTGELRGALDARGEELASLDGRHGLVLGPLLPARRKP